MGDKDYENNAPTYGQKAVGYSFNPSQDATVASIKDKTSAIVDQYNDLREKSDDPEEKRLFSLAITAAQESSMRAIKAVTRHMN